ncbi:OTU-domain-containing protein [Stereum hirsutum FP-91666 SS1]|uniref:OTU-domain-containing protein n=1 Tax=Stereum hirsutum (strain FP-91666) TaxID=721885 RepID=UPI000440FC3E|nr:OTU-domain-containing protein [Stereum hirsutum FP-91666 SS1]EIM90363.1 OTU-domain-containing protein [Stereum hirsutum FP-91666 SS1]
MAPIRLRHPKGVLTLQVDFESFTVQDLQQEIFAASEIPPSAQDLRAGYPPKQLTGIVPELPLSSLAISPGEQLIVTEKPSSRSAAPVSTGGASSARPSGPSLPVDPGARIVNPPASIPPFASSAGTSSRSAAGGGGDGGPDYVEVGGQYLVHQIVPDDNSCLFSSVALVFEQDMKKSKTIRQIVADAIRDDSETWTEAILGRSRIDYISTILSPNSWGGAIELSILATHYSTEIASIDVETGRIDHFTPSTGSSTGNRVLLIYSGIHYDAAVLAPELGVPADFCTSIVPILGEDEGSDEVLEALKGLAGKLREKRKFTNTATFDLKCEVCGKGLKGEKEASAHASETGHVKFGEYTA